VQKRISVLCAMPLLAIINMACQTRSVETDVQALNSLQKQVDAAIVAGDTARYMQFLTDDAVLMPPNGGPVIGREAIRSWNQAMSKQFSIKDYRSVDDEVVIAGDWAFRRATFDWTLIPAVAAEPIRDSGKFIILYHRQEDGSWRVARDIWNTNAAAAQ
jgi:uncharacterized protein (TIGR02246 family)